jgi:adenosylcobinamide-GDP ribazoletransferase
MPIDAVPVLAVGFVLSRALSGLATVIFPHARTSKLLKKGSNKKNKKIIAIVMAVYIAVCAVLMCYMEPLYGSVGVLGAVLSFAYYYYTSKKNFGGITGAVAAYFVQVCELVIPCVVLIAWKFL